MGSVIQGRFGGAARRAAVVRASLSPAARAWDLFERADAIDEDSARYAEAEECYRRAIALEPSFVRACVNLGNVRFRRGDPKDAERCYRKALELQPGQVEANYNLGYVYVEAGKIDAAIGCFHLALRDDPEFADAHFNMAHALEVAGARGRAVPHWRAFLALAPTSTWAPLARERLAEAAGLRVVSGGKAARR